MLKTILRSPIATVAVFAVAAALLLAGTIGAASAAPRIVSNDYRAEAQLTNIHVALTENGIVRENMDQDAHAHAAGTQYEHTLLTQLVPAGEQFEIGRTYKEELGVRNVGEAQTLGIDQYVRVTVSKYWVDENGNKDQSLDPSLIDLHFVEGNGWTIDRDASTDERTVLYYARPLAAQGNETAAMPADSTIFTDTLTIKNDVLTDKRADGTLAYQGRTFEIKAVADAVQTHNAQDAMIGAWGRTV